MNYERLGKLYVLNGGSVEALCTTDGKLSKLKNRVDDNDLITFNDVATFLYSNMERVAITDDGELELYPNTNHRIGFEGKTPIVAAEFDGPWNKQDVLVIKPEEIVAVHKHAVVYKNKVEPQHDEEVEESKDFNDIYKQLLDGFVDVLNALQEELMREGYTDEAELHNNEGTVDSQCKGTAKEAGSTCKHRRCGCIGRKRR